MTELYEVVDCRETVGIFSTLDKAKAAVEAKILADLREGHYGHHKDDQLPELTWHDQDGTGWQCGFVRMPTGRRLHPSPQWRGCEPTISRITLDPERLR